MSDIKQIPVVLTIAGSDSGGGAGIQADLRTFNEFDVYGCSVVTAVTSQNPNAVHRIDVLDVGAVKCQLESVSEAMPIHFAKTGMLAAQKIVECVAEFSAEHKLSLVVDPVMVSTSGVKLLEDSAIHSMKASLFPLADWLTPNIPEAELICNRKIKTVSDIADAATMIYKLYQCDVILKSGHFADVKTATDIICCKGKLFKLSSPRVAVDENTAHGTGCTFSSALVANLAIGESWERSVTAAKAFVYGSLTEKMFLQENLFQMYPPKKSYLEKISLTEF